MSQIDLAEFDVHSIMQGDTSPGIDATLLDGNGDAITLTGASVVFQMYSKQNRLLASGACTVTDAVNGRVTYAWSSNETDVAGNHRGQFVVTYADATQETVPNREENRMIIEVDARPGGV